jgi:PAT family beta-lactamase induction signal transducer AmpG
MATLSTHRYLRLFALCALYFAQGLPYGFITVSLVAWLAEQGLTTAETGQLLFWAGVPWSLKFLWGPVIDRYTIASMGRRRPWIIVAQAMMALSVLSMSVLDDVAMQLVGLSWLICIHNVFNSMQDVAVDALAVDILKDDERGKANGLMWGSKYLGISVGGAGIATVLAWGGFRMALVVQAVILFAIMCIPLFFRERPGEKRLPWSEGAADPTVLAARPDSMRAVVRSMLKAFSLRSSLVGVAIAVTCYIPFGISDAVSPVFFTQELEWSSESYAQIIGGPGMICGLIAAIVGGWLVDRFGARTMMAIGFVCGAVAFVAFGLLESLWHNTTVVVFYLCFQQFFVSLSTVGKFALFMRVSWVRVAGTQFTAYMALLNLSRSIGNLSAGPLDARLDYGEIFVVCGVMLFLVTLLLPFIDPGQTRRVLGDGD